jgi:KUP system potassium uptake protein
VVYGVLSLVFWSLLLVVTLKYVVLMLRADNEGEGGILSLLALVQRGLGGGNPWTRRALTLAVLGTALFYCDALITPAISVLSAVEGLELLDPSFERAVIPVTLGIIVGLFASSAAAPTRWAALFGPVMLLWFGTLAVLGVLAMLRHPEVLIALDPRWGLRCSARIRAWRW